MLNANLQRRRSNYQMTGHDTERTIIPFGTGLVLEDFRAMLDESLRASILAELRGELPTLGGQALVTITRANAAILANILAELSR
jgi:hypothetical protein